MRHLLLVSIALAVSTPALARPSSAIPQFDAAQICHATSNLGLADDQSFATCMRDETEAKNQLAKDWTSYSAEVRSRCSAETRIGGSPSYVELSTCLDMDKSVTELEKADRTLDSGMDLSSNKAIDPYTVLRQRGEAVSAR
jgi:hypothetical protein